MRFIFPDEKQYIPKGTNVGILLSAIHRDPEVWPDPDVFNPDRFSEELTQNRDLFAFVPFSAGPRNCLGNYILYNDCVKLKIFLFQFLFFIFQVKNLQCLK